MEYVKVTLSLIGVLLIIFAAYYSARWLGKKAQFSQGRTLKIIERVNLGPDKSLVIVSVGDRYMLLGVASSHIEKICDLTEEDVRQSFLPKTEGNKMSFSEALKTVIREKTKGGENK